MQGMRGDIPLSILLRPTQDDALKADEFGQIVEMLNSLAQRERQVDARIAAGGSITGVLVSGNFSRENEDQDSTLAKWLQLEELESEMAVDLDLTSLNPVTPQLAQKSVVKTPSNLHDITIEAAKLGANGMDRTLIPALQTSVARGKMPDGVTPPPLPTADSTPRAEPHEASTNTDTLLAMSLKFDEEQCEAPTSMQYAMTTLPGWSGTIPDRASSSCMVESAAGGTLREGNEQADIMAAIQLQLDALRDK
ncbi:hypothetical protein BC628DRAFT_1339191 [Trametes gibbosa]|nr:hypothetical protein BC628DRAFT_1339191 [Trametes gibbosa]